MNQINRVYEDITRVMQSALSEVGFEFFREDLDGPMGSKFLELCRGVEGIRFVWDGKESWFVLEYCTDISFKPQPKWEDIRLERIHRDEPTNEMVNNLIKAFSELIIHFRNKHK